MKIKKLNLIIGVVFFILGLSACSNTVEQEQVGANMAITFVDIEDFETLCKWSDTIVKAKYVSKEKFDSYTNIFAFEVEDDFIGNIQEEIIHVYESSDSSFIEGKSYYLFMSAMHSSLYPHVVYRRIKTGFLLGEEKQEGETSYTFYEGNSMDVEEVSDFSDYISEEVEKGNYIETKLDTFEEACERADAIYRIRIMETSEANPLVALCSYEVVEKLRERYENNKNEVNQELSDDIKKAAGVGVKKYPTVPGPIDTQVGEEFFFLGRYDEKGRFYDMYSEEHFLYPIDSTEGQYIQTFCNENEME